MVWERAGDGDLLFHAKTVGRCFVCRFRALCSRYDADATFSSLPFSSRHGRIATKVHILPVFPSISGHALVTRHLHRRPPKNAPPIPRRPERRFRGTDQNTGSHASARGTRPSVRRSAKVKSVTVSVIFIVAPCGDWTRGFSGLHGTRLWSFQARWTLISHFFFFFVYILLFFIRFKPALHRFFYVVVVVVNKKDNAFTCTESKFAYLFRSLLDVSFSSLHSVKQYKRKHPSYLPSPLHPPPSPSLYPWSSTGPYVSAICFYCFFVTPLIFWISFTLTMDFYLLKFDPARRVAVSREYLVDIKRVVNCVHPGSRQPGVYGCKYNS